MKKHIGTLLIIIGLLVISFPFVGRYIADKKQEALMEQYYLSIAADSQVNSEYEGLNDIFVEGEEAVLDGTELQTITDELLSSDDGTTGIQLSSDRVLQMVGVLRIDKISLQMPIAEGATNGVLQYAIGHMPSTPLPGETGNSVLAGHRNHSFGSYFNRLDEVEVGDVIEVEMSGITHKFEVYEVVIVEPEDVSVLATTSNNKILTLVTCTPVYHPTHRLIVHAVEKL